MKRIFITGDTHGDIDISKLNSKNFPAGKELTKEDYVIICGDFGVLWNRKFADYWLKWLDEKPWTTLWIDGNHENFDMLNEYETSIWNGGYIHRINDSVIHLMRGQVFTIYGKKFFTMGGAMSTDKEYRVEHISWWKEEIPNWAEMNLALENLELHNYKVDYILTHTCPNGIYNFRYVTIKDPTAAFLDEIRDKVEYKHWFYGHYHEDRRITSKMTAIYKEILEL